MSFSFDRSRSDFGKSRFKSKSRIGNRSSNQSFSEALIRLLNLESNASAPIVNTGLRMFIDSLVLEGVLEETLSSHFSMIDNFTKCCF